MMKNLYQAVKWMLASDFLSLGRLSRARFMPVTTVCSSDIGIFKSDEAWHG